jgi:hypothetical protein
MEKPVENNEELERALRQLADIIKELAPFLEELTGDISKFPSDEEIDWDRLKKLFLEVYGNLSGSMFLLSNDLYRRAIGFYYFVKESAENDDDFAKSVLNEMRPYYHRCLLENCDRN